MNTQTRQQGGSAIGLIIFLALFGYGVFVGLQYVPQYIETATVKTMLDNIVEKNNAERLGDMRAVQSAIDNQLFMNQMTDLKDTFKVKQYRGNFIITVSYERELDLLYTKKVMTYEKTVTLE